MINDPYIGMPINMGGRCDTVQTPAPLPNQPQTPQPKPPQQSQPTQAPANGQIHEENTNAPGSSDSANRPNEIPESSGFDSRYLGSLPLAMAYVPMQQWKTVYSPQNGLSRGTIFPELDLPFEGITILSEANNERRMR